MSDVGKKRIKGGGDTPVIRLITGKKASAQQIQGQF